jgi:biopolymer transport protein ExbD
MAYRRRHGGGSDGLVAPNLTPLLDVVLQLITFFMMLIHFGNKLEGESTSIRLPTAPAALPGGDLGLDRLVVSVDASGKLIADGGSYDESSAAPWWAEKAKARREGRATLGAGADEELPTLVVVRADKEASYGAVRRLLAAAQEQGFAHFTLVVLRGANP